MKEQGKRIIITSHIQDDIDILCNEVYEMDVRVMKKKRQGLWCGFCRHSNIVEQCISVCLMRFYTIQFFKFCLFNGKSAKLPAILSM